MVEIIGYSIAAFVVAVCLAAIVANELSRKH